MSRTYPNWKEVAAEHGIVISTRLKNCLEGDCLTLETFKSMSPTELRKIPNLGHHSCQAAIDLQNVLNGIVEPIPRKYLDRDFLKKTINKTVKALQDDLDERGGFDAVPDYLQEFMSYVDFTPNLPLSFRITKDKQGKHSITLQYSKHVLVFVEKPS